MSKQKKIALSSLMVALLLVGTLGTVALAGTGNRSYCAISTSYEVKYGSKVTMSDRVTITVKNMASSTGVARGVLQNANGVAEGTYVEAAIGGTKVGYRTVTNNQYRIALFGYKKVNGTGSAYN